MVLSAYMHHWSVYTYYWSVVCIVDILRGLKKILFCVKLQKTAQLVPIIFSSLLSVIQFL